MKMRKAAKRALKNGKSKKAVMLEFTKQKVKDYPENEELHNRILELVYKYEGSMSCAEAIGILDIVKDSIKNQ